MTTINVTMPPLTAAPKEGGSSPWGTIDGVTTILPGMWFVSTPSHGGIKLSLERQQQIPESLRRADHDTGKSWYEEDCEWAIPYCYFAEELKKAGRGIDGKLWNEEMHRKTLRTWYPEQYEQFYGVTLKPGESAVRDEQVFYKEHADDWIVVCAWGSWSEGTPRGYVKVAARKGGRHGEMDETEERLFYVKEETYSKRGEKSAFASYVIDLDTDLEILNETEENEGE